MNPSRNAWLRGFALQIRLPVVLSMVLASGLAVGLPVHAQPQPSSTDDQRARILQERKTAEAQFAKDEVACYQRFAVADCLTQRRRERRDVVSDLRRQEVLLNLADARARGSEQILRREGQVSTGSLVQDANRLAQEQATAQQRLLRMDERIAARQQAIDEEAQNTRALMERENQKRQDDAQRGTRRAQEADNQRLYDERQLRARQKTQERTEERLRRTDPVRP